MSLFKKLFGGSSSQPAAPAAAAPAPAAPSAPAPAAEQPPPSPAIAALLQAIAARRKDDPLVGAKLGAKEIAERLMAGMKNERGIHVNSLLCAAGALAGYSCQASVRALQLGLHEAQGADGKRYFFGDALNKPLAEDTYSIWSLAAGAAQKLGVQQMLDVNAIFAHVAATVGSSGFGVPRVPESQAGGDLPANYLKLIWPALFPLVKQFCPEPQQWPLLYGLAVQEIMTQTRDAIDTTLALTIVMESAVPMSKVDFAQL